MFWTSSIRKADRAKQFNSFNWLLNSSNLLIHQVLKTCEMWLKWRKNLKSLFGLQNCKNRPQALIFDKLELHQFVQYGVQIKIILCKRFTFGPSPSLLAKSSLSVWSHSLLQIDFLSDCGPQAKRSKKCCRTYMSFFRHECSIFKIAHNL